MEDFEEIAAFVKARAEELTAAGMDPAQAEKEADEEAELKFWWVV